MVTTVKSGSNVRSESATCVLAERYIRRSDDQSIGLRLPFYRVAYLAFRIGYCTFAQRALGSCPDGQRFARLLRGYRRELSSLLNRK